MAVGLGARDVLGGEDAARAGHVLDDDRPAERRCEACSPTMRASVSVALPAWNGTMNLMVRLG